MGGIVAHFSLCKSRQVADCLQPMSRASPGRGSLERIDESALGSCGVQSVDREAFAVRAGERLFLFHGQLTWSDDAPIAARGGDHDPASLIRLWKQLGEKCIEYLAGDFAIAVVDLKSRQIWCARSVSSLRPLHFCVQGDSLYLASDPRQIHRVMIIEPSLDETAVEHYLKTNELEPDATIFEHIRRIPAGEAQLFSAVGQRWSIESRGPLWQVPDVDETLYKLPVQELTEEVGRLIDRAVNRVRPDSETVVFLSGGVDSTLLWQSCVTQYRAGELDRLPRSLSAFFPGLACDEKERILSIHQALATTPDHRVSMDPATIEAENEAALAKVDYPVMGTTYFAQTTGELLTGNAKSVMTGLGGDEWFTFDPMRASFYARNTGISTRLGLVHGVVNNNEVSMKRRLLPFLRPMSRAISARFRRMQDVFPESLVRTEDRSVVRMMRLLQRNPYYPAAEQLFSSASLELKCPLMDRDLIRFASSMPPEAMIAGGVNKGILNKLAESSFTGKRRIKYRKPNFNDVVPRGIRDGAHSPSRFLRQILDAQLLDRAETEQTQLAS